MRQVSAEQFVRAFSAQRHRRRLAGHARQKPHRQRAGIRIRLIAVIRELMNRLRQILPGVQIEFGVLGSVAARLLRVRSSLRRSFVRET